MHIGRHRAHSRCQSRSAESPRATQDLPKVGEDAGDLHSSLSVTIVFAFLYALHVYVCMYVCMYACRYIYISPLPPLPPSPSFLSTLHVISSVPMLYSELYFTPLGILYIAYVHLNLPHVSFPLFLSPLHMLFTLLKASWPAITVYVTA